MKQASKAGCGGYLQDKRSTESKIKKRSAELQ